MKLGKQDSRVDAAISRAAEGARHAVDKTAQVSQTANHALRDTGHQLLEVEKKWARASGSYMHRHPMLVVGAAVAAGFALCSLLKSSRTESDYEE